MTYLTLQEQNFYDDLIKDYLENKNNSLISQFFNGGNVDLNFSYDIIKEFFQNDYKDFFENSIFLFNSERSSIIGKYKDYFWYANEDGYIFDMKWEYDENKAEEFDRIVEKLK